MAQPTSILLILFAAFALEGLLTITEGIPQKRLQMQYKVKRDANANTNYQDDYNPDLEYSDDENGYDEEALAVDPNIITRGDTFTFDKGTTIRLPCYVDKFPKAAYTIMWRKADGDPNSYLAIDNTIMDRNEQDRMSVEVVNDEDITSKIAEEARVTHRGSTLIIPLAKAGDEGQYVCIVPGKTNREIKHTVTIRDPPTITKSPSNGLLKVSKGASVTMSCYGEGRPKPTVKWHRLGKKRMPDGKLEIEAEELNFKSVTRHHSGRYECIADNGYGKPATQEITVEVEYAPEVTAEEIFVHAAAGNNVELICNVHAHPSPTVKWFKNKMELTDETAQLERHGHRHTLNIPSVNEQKDFGNYTCRASNRLGVAERILEISGKAGFAKFTSTPKGTEPTSFVLSWTSESHSDISLFELRWREHGEGSWRSEQIRPIRLNSVEWAGKHAISDLKPATRFEATVAAQNDEDWSRHSPTYHFSTFGAEPLKDPNSSTSIQPFLSTMISTRSQILLSAIVAYFMARWHNRL